MAVGAGFGDVGGIHRRLGVLDGADVVDAMAVDAGGDGGVAGFQALAVDAGQVFGI